MFRDVPGCPMFRILSTANEKCHRFFFEKIQLDFNMTTIYTFCALALARSLLLVSGKDKEKDEKVKNDVGSRTANSVGIGIDLGTTYSW